MESDSKKFLVPVYVICYGDTEEEAVEYVETALDSSEFVFADGIYGAEVIENEVEEYTDDILQ